MVGDNARLAPEDGPSHPGGNPVANLKSIAHRRCLREVAFELALAEENIYSPPGCLQGGTGVTKGTVEAVVSVILQGYLAHKKTPCPRTLPQAYA